jgi:hypothetical protein
MTRRAVPWTFIAGALLSLMLLLTNAVLASKGGSKIPNIRGHWDGFFLDAGGTDVPGLVRSDVTEQVGRRIAGDGRLLDAATEAQLAVFHYSGTLAADDVINANGTTPKGRVALHGGVQLFAGRKGNAGVMDGQLHFVPRRGEPSQVGTLLLHPFPDANSPDISGEGLGTFRSRLDSTFAGGLTLDLQPRERNAFTGFVNFTPHSDLHAPFSWHSRTTVNDEGTLVLIAQGKTGRMIVQGAVFPGMAGPTSSDVDGQYTLILNDGRSDVGFYNFSINRVNR